MSMNCISCGGKPVKAGYYFITARDFFGRTNLLGAVGVGMCKKCISKYYTGFLRRPIVYSVLALLGALVCVSMMVFLSGRGTVMQYVILAFLTALCLAGAVTNFIRICRIVAAVKDPDGLVRSMTPAETAAVGARMIAGKRVLTDNILFSWQNLSSVEDGDDPLSPEEAEKVRQPFALPMKRGLALITLRRKEPRIPYTNVPDTMDASVRRLILRAIKQ